ncbi:MAG TPA: hypothetical protein VF126_06550 [Acidobacteriaceae bacterium]
MTRSPDRKLLSYLAPCDPHISRLALVLREIVLEEPPDAIETIIKSYAISIGFSFTGKTIKGRLLSRRRLHQPRTLEAFRALTADAG